MQSHFSISRKHTGTAIRTFTNETIKKWRKEEVGVTANWVDIHNFRGNPGSFLLLPDAQRHLSEVWLGVESEADIWSFAALSPALPDGDYYLADSPAANKATHAALGWTLGFYRFDRYRTQPSNGVRKARLIWPDAADRAYVLAMAEAICLVRDLINMPAEDLGPAELADAAKSLAKRFTAKCEVITGDALLKQNYPSIHMVGRASARAPRLIDLRYGTRGPKITLVGKGVCFDSGGLDIKSASNMQLMKKDMGGAAHVLGLAHAIMALQLPIRLRVLIPAVENSISANAYRPMDVLKTRKGLTVEIGNTDAEGRIILCDALHEAASERPDLLIDCATLTGAARVALGAELPALFCNNDEVAEALLKSAKAAQDPFWQMPLHRPYRRLMESKVADISSTGNDSLAGAILAALFLAEFVPNNIPWVHIDMMAWNPVARTGRPVGGEAMGLRALYAYIAGLARTHSEGTKFGKTGGTRKERGAAKPKKAVSPRRR